VTKLDAVHMHPYCVFMTASCKTVCLFQNAQYIKNSAGLNK